MNANQTLAQWQHDFWQLLLAAPGAAGVGDTLRAHPALAIYRNTSTKGAIDALQANHPAVLRLVGEDWFRAAALAYVRAYPPGDTRMLFYGDRFADFLQGFGPAAELTYLAAVARLDRLWVESHAAADRPCLDLAALSALPMDQWDGLRLQPHPAARWMWFDDAPAYSIWQACRAQADDANPAHWQAEGALLTRPLDTVCWAPLSRGGCALLDTCAAGQALGRAAEFSAAIDPDTPLAATLHTLLAQGAFCALP